MWKCAVENSPWFQGSPLVWILQRFFFFLRHNNEIGKSDHPYPQLKVSRQNLWGWIVFLNMFQHWRSCAQRMPGGACGLASVIWQDKRSRRLPWGLVITLSGFPFPCMLLEANALSGQSLYLKMPWFYSLGLFSSFREGMWRKEKNHLGIKHAKGFTRVLKQMCWPICVPRLLTIEGQDHLKDHLKGLN